MSLIKKQVYKLNNLFKKDLGLLPLIKKVPSAKYALEYAYREGVIFKLEECMGKAIADCYNNAVVLNPTFSWGPVELLACLTHELTHLYDCKVFQVDQFKLLIKGDEQAFIDNYALFEYYGWAEEYKVLKILKVKNGTTKFIDKHGFNAFFNECPIGGLMRGGMVSTYVQFFQHQYAVKRATLAYYQDLIDKNPVNTFEDLVRLEGLLHGREIS